MSRGASSSGSCSATTSASFCWDTVLLSVGSGGAEPAAELERHECEAAQEDEQVLEPGPAGDKEDGEGGVLRRHPEVVQEDERAAVVVGAALGVRGAA